MAHTCISWKGYTWSSPCLQMCYPIGAWAPTDTVLTAHLDMSLLVMMVYNYLLDNRPHHLRLNQHRNNTIVHLLRSPTYQNGTTTFSSLCCTSPGQSGNTVLVRCVFYNFAAVHFKYVFSDQNVSQNMITSWNPNLFRIIVPLFWCLFVVSLDKLTKQSIYQ